MKLYFVNSKSTLKGPFAIKDSWGNRCIENGDFCIVASLNNLKFIHINDCPKVNSNWRDFYVVSIRETHFLSIDSNVMLYNYDGFNGRVGRKDLLPLFLNVFDNQYIDDLIHNLIGILDYKTDCVDLSIYMNLLQVNQVQNELIESSYNKPLFYEFLSDDVKKIYDDGIDKQLSIKSIYIGIRNKYPKSFKKSLNDFLSKYPGKGIYDIS